MKKNRIILGIFCLITIIFICGCTEQNNQGDTTENKITMTAKELYYDQETIQGADNITINYKSLDDGDTLVIQDTIFKIFYEEIVDKTMVTFVWTEENLSKPMNIEFEGNITGSYFNNEQVKITVKIKHVIFSYQGVPHDMELFEEQWVSEDYFNSNRYKPLPQSCISKL